MTIGAIEFEGGRKISHNSYLKNICLIIRDNVIRLDIAQDGAIALEHVLNARIFDRDTRSFDGVYPRRPRGRT